MVGGQMLDMKGEGLELDLSQLAKIHENKTGKLLTFPFVAAGIVAQQEDRVMENLQEAGRLIGLAFQVRDDILDVTADFESLGKRLKRCGRWEINLPCSSWFGKIICHSRGITK